MVQITERIWAVPQLVSAAMMDTLSKQAAHPSKYLRRPTACMLTVQLKISKQGQQQTATYPLGKGQ